MNKIPADRPSNHKHLITAEDWFNKGKTDAWSGHTKSAPEHDAQAASMYDLGYCEGIIGRSPFAKTKNNAA